VYQRLIYKALTIMLVQGIKTFLVSFFILFVFYRLVTRHIIAIEKFLKNVSLQTPFAELKLSRRTKKVSDELDHLVGAYNAMTENLLQAYDDVRVVNVQLKKDIAARKLAEAEVSLLNEQLEHRVRVRTKELEGANKELNAFCYSVSHDLRAPLRRIDGFRKNLTLKYSGKIDSQGEHYLSRMQACAHEMNAMIDSFLVLSRSTNTELALTEVNLSEVVSNALANLQEKDQHRKVNLQIQPNMVALCDAGLVELLINNVIDNAWKYSANREEAVIRFSRKKCKGERIYIIEDNGAGFDMNLAENLFSPFTRLHKLSDFQGIGIGLATVKRVAARHGGRVWAESSVDQGAKFFFTLSP
jgi:light-regulated signal transduction histidine kinase (bacteriophytochrome)/HAMP domain-containing protein